jgi:hypothetical protein
MKNQVKNFRQFINESGLGYGYAFRQDLRKELVGGKGQKREYDALSDAERMELEGLFSRINLDGSDEAKHVLRGFLRNLSKYNSMAEIKAAIMQAREALDSPSHLEEPKWDISPRREDTPSPGSEGSGYYYGEDK